MASPSPFLKLPLTLFRVLPPADGPPTEQQLFVPGSDRTAPDHRACCSDSLHSGLARAMDVTRPAGCEGEGTIRRERPYSRHNNFAESRFCHRPYEFPADSLRWWTTFMERLQYLLKKGRTTLMRFLCTALAIQKSVVTSTAHSSSWSMLFYRDSAETPMDCTVSKRPE